MDSAAIDRANLLEQGEVWIDKEGTVWRIEEMETSHIQNLIRWLDRQDVAGPYPNFNGEMAQFYAERDWGRYADGEYPLREALVEELGRRGEEVGE